MNLFNLKNTQIAMLKATALSTALLALFATPIMPVSAQGAGSSKELEVPRGFNFTQQRQVTLDLTLSQTNVLAVRVYGLNFQGKDKDDTQAELPSLLSINKLLYGTSLYKTIEVPVQYTHMVVDYGQENVEPVLIPQDNLLVITD